MRNPIKKLSQANDLVTSMLVVLIGLPVGTLLLFLVMILVKGMLFLSN